MGRKMQGPNLDTKFTESCHLGVFFLAKDRDHSLLSFSVMIRREYLIIGAGAAGLAACEAIRALDKKGSIMLVSAEPHCGVRRPELLPAMLGAKPAPIEKLVTHDMSWFAKNKIDVKTFFKVSRGANHESNALAVANKQVDVATNNSENLDKIKDRLPRSEEHTSELQSQ